MPYLNPFGPQHQLAPVGPVPYNVVDGVNLRYQMMMSAKNFSDSSQKSRKSNVDTNNSKTRLAENINPYRIPNMSKQEILGNLPSNWSFTDHKGFIHVRDSNGNIRMRIDPPDKLTKYDHVHLYDHFGNPLDKDLNKVDRKSPEAHIPYKKER